MADQPGFSQREHFHRRVGKLEQRGRRLVDALVGRLRGEHDRDQQCVGVDIVKLGFGFRCRRLQPREEGFDVRFREGAGHVGSRKGG